MFYKIVLNKVKTLGNSCRGTPTALIGIRTSLSGKKMEQVE